eukprot:jgi/Tetstr1/421534/TSEL_012481.t1
MLSSAGKPAGHPDGGDPGKCPFAMMMAAAEARPDMVEKWKAEAAECDSDSSEDEEEAAMMEELLATHKQRSEATMAEMAATVRELEGEGEAKERRDRMMAAMKHEFSKQDLNGAAAMMAKLSPAEMEMMKGMVAESAGSEAKEGCPFSAMFGAMDKLGALEAAPAAAGGELAAPKGGHGAGGDASTCPFAAMFGGATPGPKPKALPDPAGEPEECAASALTAAPHQAADAAAAAASSCPFAAMFGMPEAPAKKQPVSIVEKYMRDNNITEADLAAEAEADADGGCPFAQIFGSMPSTDEKETARQQAIENADKPGQGQYIWKRKQVPVEESKEEEEEEESEEEEEEAKDGRLGRGDIPDTQEGLNDAIRKAGEIKSAKMKADPRRREWEAAPIWMRCTCAEEGELGEARQLPFEGKLEKAKEWREQANDLFKQGNNETAISLYGKSLGIFLWFTRGEGRSTENVKLIDEIEALHGADKHQAVDVVTKALINIAACLTKMSNWKEVIYACGKALEYSPRSVKALYRRAHAYRADNSAYMLELAVKDLKRALAIDPASTDVKRAYRQFAAELKEQNKKDGKTFGEMFSRGDLYTAEEVEKMKKEAGSGSVLGEMDEASKALAKQMGIDLNDPRVRAELARLEAAKKAKDASGGAGAGAAEPREQHWWIKATLKYKWVVYFLIALHITWRMWVAISSLPVHRAQLAREVGGNSMWDGANASTMSGMARSGDAFDEL